MTRLYYRVGDEVFDSYTKAVSRAKSLRLSLVACYEPIYEETKVDPKLRERRAAAIRQGLKGGRERF